MAKARWSITVIAALVIGIWFANTTWRSRKQIWQMQSALIGGSVGFVAGRLSSKKRLKAKPNYPRLKIDN